MSKPSAPTERNPVATRADLIAAARKEFAEFGYGETNTNRIAKRAGYAPQTFYRHFDNKKAIFLEIYKLWVEEEATSLDGVRDAKKAAAFVIRHHRQSLRFRRSLRELSVSDEDVRGARAASRLEQMARLRTRLGHLKGMADAVLAAHLLTIERISDACAEREFDDLGVSAAEAEEQLVRVMRAAFAVRRG